MRRRIPVRKRLVVRLLFVSALIAVCSVAATAWLAVTTTTSALKEEQGQDLAAGNRILAQLSGYAATHSDWAGIRPTLRELAARTGRRIALTTADHTLVADSAPPGTPLPPRPAATVDPLRTDTYTETGAQLSGIDPRVVGPYLLPEAERAKLDSLAAQREHCYERHGLRAGTERTESGRPVVTVADGADPSAYGADVCEDGRLNTPTATEQKALDALIDLVRPCLRKNGLDLGGRLFFFFDPRVKDPFDDGFLGSSSPGSAPARPRGPPSAASRPPAVPSSSPTSPRWPSCSSASATRTPPVSTCHRPTRPRWWAWPGWSSPSPWP